MKNLFTLVKDYGPLCVGLDPNIDRMPCADEQEIYAVYDSFCYKLIKSLYPFVKILKFQSAYFESAGTEGLTALKHLIHDAQLYGCYTILDAKRSDISTTAEAYAKAAFDVYNADALTIVPFMGEQSIRTFVDYARARNKQIFVVAYPTENSIYSSHVMDTLSLIQKIGDENINNGYGDVGAVVSGILPNQIQVFREHVPRVFFLIPGMGTQGGKIEEQAAAFKDKNGAILSYSRSIIYADNPLEMAKKTLEEINLNLG